MKGFIQFIRTQGVAGLAVGFILGGAISKLVTAIINDMINPFISIALGATKGLEKASFKIAGATFMWGHLLSAFIDFLVISLVVYFGVKLLKIDKVQPKVSVKTT
jgi:large conductance mechanosensitive channel